MSKETYKNENDFFDSILGGDEYGRFFMSDEDADDYEKKEKKAKKKKKLKKQLKKLGLDTSVLDEKKGLKKAKKMIEDAKKSGKPEKKKDKKKDKDKSLVKAVRDDGVIEMKKSAIKSVEEVVTPVLQDTPPYYHDLEKDEYIIRDALKISDQQAVTAVKAYAKLRRMNDPETGLFGIHSERKQALPSGQDKHGKHDKKKSGEKRNEESLKNAIEVIDAAIADNEKEQAKAEAEE